jgi:hypothetical protein
MLSLFRFRRGRGPMDLALGMAGVRLGERLLQVGPGDPAVFVKAAAKAGLTGRAVAIVESAEEKAALEAAAAHDGVFVEVWQAATGAWPCDDEAFDVSLVDGNALLAGNAGQQERWLADTQRVVRSGGRVLAVYRKPRGLASRLGFELRESEDGTAQSLMRLLNRAGFGPVRFLAAREGLTFVEAFRPSTEARGGIVQP